MKILISAYACDPYRGSEPGAGWAAVKRISSKHDVFLITEDHNRVGLERGRMEGLLPKNVHIRYLRKHKPHLENRLLARFQDWFRYHDFNKKVLQAAYEWHEQEQFDLCHQLTIATWRVASPLWQLPIPFVWGPLGGSCYMPCLFRSILSLSSRIFETIRDINTQIALSSSAIKNAFIHTDVVIAANAGTFKFIRALRPTQSIVQAPYMSITHKDQLQFERSPEDIGGDGPIRLFAGGNIEGRKGVSLALRALKIIHDKGIPFHYTIAGGGPEVDNLLALAKQLGIESSVDFRAGYSGNAYIEALQSSDVYLLPSFRETLGMTLLEAILAGCYPVVANTSAQGELVSMAGGTAVPLTDIDSMIHGLAEGIIWFHEHRSEIASLNQKSIKILMQHFSSERYQQVLESAYEIAIEEHAKKKHH